MRTGTLPGMSLLIEKDMDCQSCEAGSGSPPGLPAELSTLIKCYQEQMDYQFTWKVQGGELQTSITLVFRKRTVKQQKLKNKAVKTRDSERVKKFHESQDNQTAETQTQICETTTCETQTTNETVTCDKGIQNTIIKDTKEKYRRDRSEERKRTSEIARVPNMPDIDLNESPESAAGVSVTNILLSGQPVTVWS